MIPKILGLLLALCWLQAVYGATFSKVYVQNGAEVIPVEYVNYGAPSVVTNRQIAALSAPPIGSALPLPNVVSPCVAPCVVPSQIGTFAPVPNAKIIYNTPSLPTVVVPNNDEKSSYEYSYVVYDEDTGDKKAQRELSDGSVVHGEYSFIQPDGYIREVKYTADDLTGFNAVVKSFLPESAYGIEKKKAESKDKSEPPPCKETKSEALKVEPDNSQAALLKPEHDLASTLSVVPVDHTPAEQVPDPPVENIISHDDKPKPEQVSVHFGETPAEHAAEQSPGYTPKPATENVAENTPKLSQSEQLETPAEHAKHGPHHAEVVSSAKPTEHPPESAHEEEESHVDPVAQPAAVEVIQAPTKEDCDQKTHAAVQAPPQTPQISIPNGLATYSDILRCIQAAMANKDANAPNISPLTYIILPGANKLC